MSVSHPKGGLWQQCVRSYPKLAALVVTACFFLPGGMAHAIVVDRLVAPFDPAPVNRTPPGLDTQHEATGVEDNDPETVIGGDPGWFNVPTNRSGIYLGNQWYLDAVHVTTSGIKTIRLTDDDGVDQSYTEIPGTRFTIQNPSMFRGITMSANSDLLLYRVGTNANGETPEEANASVKTLDHTDASRVLSIADSTHTENSDVLFIGVGRNRAVNTNNANGHFTFDTSSWPDTDSATGFFYTEQSGKTWGTNQVANDSGVEENASGNPIFDSNNDVVVNLGTTQNPLLVVSQVTRFDAGIGDAQAAGSDSGGPAFVRNSAGEWELGGIMHAIALEEGQPNFLAAFGNHTFFTDIGNPLTTYRSQILDRYDDDYSVAGDVNLDGVADMDDLDALAAGWIDPLREAGIATWERGDLNQDGDTNLADFALLREALNGAVGAVELNAALVSAGITGVSPIPEPSTAVLLLTASGMLATKRSRRRT